MFSKRVGVIFCLILCNFFHCCCTFKEQELQRNVIDLVKIWANEIGKKLFHLSNTLTQPQRVEDSFKHLKDQLERVEGMQILRKIKEDMRTIMAKKTEAVKRIAEYAEFLSYYRKNEPLFANSSYQYYNADNVTDIDDDDERLKVNYDIQLAECNWFCQQRNLKPLDHNSFTREELDALYRVKNANDEKNDCDCTNQLDRYSDKEEEFYLTLPMEYDARFGENVNLNMSIIKTPINVYHRDEKVLEGIRWSEALDFVFKDNMAKDPTLTWQYFASPHGFMRHYPAIKWSTETYDQTYDFRTRSWYTEAMTSPKDIMILMDNSGSMVGTHRGLCSHIVNDILDTLNDNDFVNIYIFNNSTEPLVGCFNNTLVQANEENLRLLRESLPVYEDIFVSDISVALEKAFEILKNFRRFSTSAACNQAIMLITAGIDYDFNFDLFKLYNWHSNNPVRIFTYQIGSDCTDARHMEWIACANMGYYVNMTVMSDVREKILNYMNVLSRPINYNYTHKDSEVWSYLHVDLADRRLSNWLWRKFEGNRQREVFLDHVKRDYMRLNKLLTSRGHMLLKEEHEYEKYKTKYMDYNYMTTVSLPVYGRRDNEIDLIGVAGVDLPIKLLKSLIPYHRLGTNGYAFICTNNGYVLTHPDHRPEFENILKPTFNRVDFLEVEILNDESEPRLFNETIVSLREKVVNHTENQQTLQVKFTLNEMKRVILSGREYFLMPLGPFTLGIVLPQKYGRVKIRPSATKNFAAAMGLLKTTYWKVHPDWIYCKSCEGATPEDKINNFLKTNPAPKDMEPLFSLLLHDANNTIWFEDPLDTEKDKVIRKYFVNKIFLSTHSGLTRWRNFDVSFIVVEDDKDSFEKRNNRSIDEDWYRRAVEENYNDERKFLYSVPFEISGYENNTMITGTKAIYLKNKNMKTPIAVVGLQFNHRAMYELYNEITLKSHNRTVKCGTGRRCNITCESDYLNCFILDNNAYIVLSDEIEYTGRFIGDIRADIMYHLIEDGVFEDTRMFDYQAICQKEPPKKRKRNAAGSPAMRFRKMFQHLLGITNWALATILFWVKSIVAGPNYQSLKEDTIAVEKLEIKKTYPTPCDHEFWLFTLKDKFRSSVYHENATKFDCEWPYVVEKIPDSNLLFLAINGRCKFGTKTYINSPQPKEIIYNETLPCYIATRNNYTRRSYMNCYSHDEREMGLNERDSFYCGHTWKKPKEPGC